MEELIKIPEWATNADYTIQVFLPLKYAEYDSVELWVIDNRTKRTEAKYSTDVLAPLPYITDGVSVLLDQVDPEDGTLKDVVEIQIQRATNKDFLAGIKYAEIKERVTDGDWEEGEKNIIARQFFACFFTPEMAK